MNQPQLIFGCLLHVLICTYVLFQIFDLLRAVLLGLDLFLQLLLLLYVCTVLGTQLNTAHRDNDCQKQDHRTDAQHTPPVLLHLFFPAPCPVLLFDTSHINYSPISPAFTGYYLLSYLFSPVCSTVFAEFPSPPCVQFFSQFSRDFRQTGEKNAPQHNT